MNLSSIFKQEQLLSYWLDKINQGAKANAWEKATHTGSTEALRRFLEKFERALQSLPEHNMENEIELADYALSKLDALFKSLEIGEAREIDRQTACIFATFLQDQFKRLRKYAEELDDYYTDNS